ncbi:metal tolerance protein c3-related [Anaeramoeba flamelloides]|uniref:Metal tolerance protein c3-related n=1 Tax=Anaeramoeba flamelloides TaxID=1746091 RepID=A0AAV7YTQ9_9EUKA|nr:metal tolerance protein c3-related [Anaeramoeba flamelloides]
MTETPKKVQKKSQFISDSHGINPEIPFITPSKKNEQSRLLSERDLDIDGIPFTDQNPLPEQITFISDSSESETIKKKSKTRYRQIFKAKYEAPIESHAHFTCGHYITFKNLDDKELLSRKCIICSQGNSLNKLLVHKTQQCPKDMISDLAQFNKVEPHPKANKKMSKSVKKYYLRQTQVRQQFQNDLEETSSFEEKREEREKYLEEVAEHSKRMVRLSFSVNIILVILKIIATLQSESLTMLASMVDSVLDIVAGLIIFITDILIHRTSYKDQFKFPIGKGKFEPVGILVFSAVMSTVACQVILSAIQDLIAKKTDVTLGQFALIILIATVVVKFFLWLLCRKSKQDLVKALADDHRNDVWSNFFGIIMALIGTYLVWWFDLVGAMLISGLILFNWAKTMFENIMLLIGKGAPMDFLNRITFLVMTHNEIIQGVDKVKAYQFAQNYFVEVDIILPKDMLLIDAHDIGESLQRKIEALEEVDVCFVHVDYLGKNTKKD